MKFYHNCSGFMVDDIDQAVEFYRDNFGWKVERQSDHFCQMGTGNKGIFFLWQWDHLVEHLGAEAMSKVKHMTQSALYMDHPDEVDKAYEELKAKGYEFIAAPQDWAWNAHAAYFVDDEGYMWEIYSWVFES